MQQEFCGTIAQRLTFIIQFSGILAKLSSTILPSHRPEGHQNDAHKFYDARHCRPKPRRTRYLTRARRDAALSVAAIWYKERCAARFE